MKPPFPPLLYCVLLFLGMLLMLEAGRLFARKKTEGAHEGLNSTEAAVFALFGLLIAFTFSGAATRFQEKRMLVAEEAAAIQTAYLRVDLMPPDQQEAIRELFRGYLDSRLATYQKLPDMDAAAVEMEKWRQLQDRIWVAATKGASSPGAGPDAALLLLPALNEMFDMAEK